MLYLDASGSTVKKKKKKKNFNGKLLIIKFSWEALDSLSRINFIVYPIKTFFILILEKTLNDSLNGDKTDMPAADCRLPRWDVVGELSTKVLWVKKIIENILL